MNRKMEDFSDEKLVHASQKGDLEAFTVLARRYQEKIYRTIMAMTKNHLDADDLAQDTLLQAYKSLKSFKLQSSFYTWVYRIAINLTLNYLKKTGWEKSRADVELETYAPDTRSPRDVSSAERNSLKKEFRRKLKEAIDSLPIPYKTTFVLIEFRGMSHKQASLILRCSENTVSWRIHKARKMLQSKLKPYFERGII